MYVAGRQVRRTCKGLRNKGINACCWQTGQKDLQRGWGTKGLMGVAATSFLNRFGEAVRH